MNSFTRNSEIEQERREAQAVLNNPDSNQLDRDLAHLRLQQEDGTRGYGSITHADGVIDTDPSLRPDVWQIVEAYEEGRVDLGDLEIIQMVEDPLLMNRCKAVKAHVLPNGRPSFRMAYPRLARASTNVMNNNSYGVEQRASGTAVMACLMRPEDGEASLSFFRKAIQARPEDWRLRNNIATVYVSMGKHNLSLDALTQASELVPDDSFERFELDSLRGKVLFNLNRMDEAKKFFIRISDDKDKFKDKMDATDVGHLIVTEYMLCMIYGAEKNSDKVVEQWKSAEAQRDALAPDVRKRIDWDCRHLAQTMMAHLDSDLLSHQECHNCRKLCSDPKKCSRCKAALYCSKECQVAAWKSGHKKLCKEAKETRREVKKENKLTAKQLEAVKKLPPLDATLDPYVLWAKAKKLSGTTGKQFDAVFYFCVAFFLDFALDAQDMGPAKMAVEACGQPNHPLVLALKMMTHKDKNDPLGFIGENYRKAVEFMEKHDTKQQASVPYATESTIEELDRVQFGFSLCCIFQARWLGRYFTVTSMEQAQSSMHKAAFDQILNLVRDCQLQPERWLTLQYELGYSNLDVGAGGEGKRWLDMFVENLKALENRKGVKVSKHWKQFRAKARTKLALAQHLLAAQQSGAYIP